MVVEGSRDKGEGHVGEIKGAGGSRSTTFVRHGQGEMSDCVYLYLLASAGNTSVSALRRQSSGPGMQHRMHMHEGFRGCDKGWSWPVVTRS